MPGRSDFLEHNGKARGLVTLISQVRWRDSETLTYSAPGGTFQFSTRGGESKPAPVASLPHENLAPFPMPQPRGGQLDEVRGPNGLRALHENGNLIVTGSENREIFRTKDGGQNRIKYGKASWVYGEELSQNLAKGFSPDGAYLWFYRFDEGKVLDFFTLLDQSRTQNRIAVEAYPKPGTDNPEVDVLVLEIATGRVATVPVRPGKFDESLGHYVHGIQWAADSKELHFHRMNRRQNEKELCGFDPKTGTVRIIDRETNPKGWVEYTPLRDLSVPAPSRSNPASSPNPNWLIVSEASGFYNLYWLNLATGTRTPITKFPFDVIRVLGVYRELNRMIVLTAGPKNPYHHQVWSMDLDGRNQRQLSDDWFANQGFPAPDGSHVAVVRQNASNPPELIIMTTDGSGKKELAKSDVSRLTSSAYRRSEVMWFPSLDKKWRLMGRVHFPANFDPKKKYPVLFDVYAGPLPMEWGVPAENFELSENIAHYGFIIADVEVRGGHARGRGFRQEINETLGIVEIAAMASHLGSLPYIDATRIGIFGTSYGGYAAVMAILRHPDLFAAASASSIVSDWRQYDTTYSERYMGLAPNQAYEKGSALTYAKNLKGHLLIYYGTQDENTHPNHAFALIKALQLAGKSFEVQVGPDMGHTSLNNLRMMEFFIERLVMDRGSRS
jgi:dipeptidyl-peptidase-4